MELGKHLTAASPNPDADSPPINRFDRQVCRNW